ncbi:MAG: SOS response-associated peptidase [Acidobacteria bacterium]|nr:SOS response-associated peptidase [Acidobacteriota bacterium]MCG3192701.1 putative SOS response-associated peptidase YedK [Thermoanaerobaculia bacterium]MCK6685055.1 SOS response-associated peptidase [Thermoanaerobaculia bacterium]
MCGRYVISSPLDVLKQRFQFSLDGPSFPPRYNACPSQDLPVVAAVPGGRRLALMKWGLVPSWTKDLTQAQRPINARSEGVSEKPSFRGPLRKGRVLVLANGYYEWGQNPGGKGKTPYYFHLMGDAPTTAGEPFALAGLSDRFKGTGGETLDTFAILTAEANPLAGKVHGRMPVILPREAEETWLSGSVEEALRLLVPFPEERMEAYRVSIRVNSPATDDANLVESLGPLR